MATKPKDQSSKTQDPGAEAPGQKPLAEWGKDQAKVANTSELSRASGKDRATVKKLLLAAGLAPKFQRARETFWDLDEATAALSRDPHEVAAGAPLTHARTQKVKLESAHIALKLQRERGEVASVAEMREEAFNLVKAMHTRFSRYAKSEAWNKLRKTFNKRSEFEKTLSTDVALIFDDLKRDYPEIL